MDTVLLMLTCCLSVAFTEPTTENEQMNLQNISTVTGQEIVINSTNAPYVNSSEHLAISTTLMAGTALTSAAGENNTSTIRTSAASTTTSSHSPASESTTAEVAFTNRTAQSTDVTTATQTKTSVRPTEYNTSVSHTTTSAAATTTANSSVVNGTLQSVLSTPGVRLSLSERNLTITFSVMLGIFALAVVAIKLHRCSHKLQFLHQPLNNTEDLNVSTADPDTLVISGGLYDGHPIYDHVPPEGQDESQFRLEFLH